MRRRSLLRTLAVSGAVCTGVGIGTSTTNLVQSVQAQSSSDWQQQQRLLPPDSEQQNGFGYKIELSDGGETALVNTTTSSVYVYAIQNNQWIFQKELTDPDGDSESRFGFDIALSGDGSTALVGAPNARPTTQTETTQPRSGVVHAFSSDDGSWSLEQRIHTDTTVSDDALGAAVSVSNDGSTALIGGLERISNECVVFSRNGGNWIQRDKFTSSDVEGGDRFGSVVALSGDGSTAIVSAVRKEISESDPFRLGSAYIFDQNDDTWSEQRKLTGGSNRQWGPFGISLSLSDNGTTALIGSKSANAEGSGIEAFEDSAYVFSRNNNEWSQDQILVTESDESQQNNILPVSLSASGTTAVVADVYEDEFTGSAYIFSKNGSTWSQQQKLTVDINKSGTFGSGIAISGDGNTILAGAPLEDTESGDQAGATYVFTNNGNFSDDTQVSLSNVQIDDDTIDSTGSHTLSFSVSGVSPDDVKDNIRIALPEEVTVESVIEASSPNTSYNVTVQQETNPIELYVDPTGSNDPVEMNIEVRLRLSSDTI